MCDCGVVAAVVLGLGHGLLERVQVRADHVGRQARHLPSHEHVTQDFWDLGYFTEIVNGTEIPSHSIFSLSPSSVNKNLLTTVSVEGGSGLVNTGKVPGGETIYDRTLPKHTFQ